MNPDNTRQGEVVWNTTKLQAPPLAPSPAGGGGGYSRIYSRPWWQPASDSASKWRANPDLSAHASSVPSWPAAQGPVLYPVAGTSAATPFVAASLAVIAAQERVQGRPPLGHVAPLLYSLQRTKPQTFYDIVQGDNDVYGVGCCTARKGYDAASGLGAPVLPEILANLPAPGGS